MLYQIFKRDPRTYGGGQEPIVHLVSSLPRIVEAGCQYAFTDRHAYMRTSQFYTNPDDLKYLRWDVIGSRDWKNTPDEPDRQEYKMAEFLVHKFVPWSCIRGLGVFSQSYKQDVEATLAKHTVQTRVKVYQEWYY